MQFTVYNFTFVVSAQRIQDEIDGKKEEMHNYFSEDEDTEQQLNNKRAKRDQLCGEIQ